MVYALERARQKYLDDLNTREMWLERCRAKCREALIEDCVLQRRQCSPAPKRSSIPFRRRPSERTDQVKTGNIKSTATLTWATDTVQWTVVNVSMKSWTLDSEVTIWKTVWKLCVKPLKLNLYASSHNLNTVISRNPQILNVMCALNVLECVRTDSYLNLL